MSKTTPEEAKEFAKKHGLYSSALAVEHWHANPEKLAALIDEARGVDAEPVAEAAKFVKGLVEDLGFNVWAEDGNEVDGVHPPRSDSMSYAQFMDAADWLVKYGFADWDSSGRVDMLIFHKVAHPAPSQPAAPTIKDSLNVQWPECKKCGGNLWQCMACHPTAAPVELPVVAWFADDGDSQGLALKENAALRNCEPGTVAEALVKLSDAQAAIAAGRKAS